MKQNIKIAKQILKIAKNIISSQLIGDAFYRIMDEQKKQISVNFSINTTSRDKMMGWFDAMLARPGEIIPLGQKYGFEDMSDTMDAGAGLQGIIFSICLKGNDESDMEGFIKELKSKFHCNEIKK